jgi:hypothetical protein
MTMLSSNAMNDSFVAQNFSSLAEVITRAGLAANPIEITVESLGEIDLRRVTSRMNRIRPADGTGRPGQKF